MAVSSSVGSLSVILARLWFLVEFWWLAVFTAVSCSPFAFPRNRDHTHMHSLVYLTAHLQASFRRRCVRDTSLFHHPAASTSLTMRSIFRRIRLRNPPPPTSDCNAWSVDVCKPGSLIVLLTIAPYSTRSGAAPLSMSTLLHSSLPSLRNESSPSMSIQLMVDLVVIVVTWRGSRRICTVDAAARGDHVLRVPS